MNRRYSDFSNERDVARRPHSIAPHFASVRVIIAVRGAPHHACGSGMGLPVTSLMTAKNLRAAGIHCNVWAVKDAEALRLRLSREQWNTERQITHVIMNTPSFASPADYAEMATTWPETSFVMLNHTALACMSFDSNDWHYIRELLQLQASVDNVFVAGNSPRFYQSIRAGFGEKALWLPNLYDLTAFRPPRGGNSCYAPLRIGSFGEARPWKNPLVAAQAALEIAREVGASDLELYVNPDRPETWSGAQARRRLFEGLPRAKLITVPWQTWSSFLNTVEAMDLMLFASYDEAFGMVPADGIAVGVPSVTAPALEWSPMSWQANHPEDPACLKSVGLSLLHGRSGAMQAGRKALTDYVESGTRKWIDFLTQ